MRKVFPTPRFNKDLKLVKKHERYAKIKTNLERYINMLINGETLPPEAKNHPLSKASPKEYKGCWDFHVIPDIVVVYRMDKDALYLLRIGKHNNLGLTENFSDN